MNAKKHTPDENVEAVDVTDAEAVTGAAAVEPTDADAVDLTDADAATDDAVQETLVRDETAPDATGTDETVTDPTGTDETVTDIAAQPALVLPDDRLPAETVDVGALDDADAETLSASPTAVLADEPVIASTTSAARPASAPRYATVAEASADILPPDPVVAAPAPAALAPVAPLGSPRTRWAGIIWGLALAAVAALALLITLDPARRAAAADWWLSVNGVTGTAYVFLALGAVAVLCAVVGIIGRAQRKRIAKRTAS